jgi:hypothetical protein
MPFCPPLKYLRETIGSLVASPKAAILDDRSPAIDEHDPADVSAQSITDLSDRLASPNVLLHASKIINITEKSRRGQSQYPPNSQRW